MAEINKKIKLIELFGGIGSPRKALQNIGINIDSLAYVDNNQSAVNAYNVLFNENYKTQDIKDVISLGKNEIDLLVFGSPCTDFSIAGKQDINKGNSILYMEVIRLIEQVPLSTRPKFIIWENVKTLKR